MGWVIRKPEDRSNPTLAGGVYGRYITEGLGVYWRYINNKVSFILFVSDGGKYGMDSIVEFSYKSSAISEYKFHPGTFTKQLNPLSVDQYVSSASTDTVAILNTVLATAGETLADGDKIRWVNPANWIPGGLNDGPYWITNKSSDATYTYFKLSSTDPATSTTLVDITSFGTTGSEAYKISKGSGFDDPDQGLPMYCPEVNTTFSGICYLEGYLPSQYNQDEEPDWDQFRIIGWGRKLMEFDNSGNEVGLVSNGTYRLSNSGLVALDALITECKISKTRVDFTSFNALKDDSAITVLQRGITEGLGRGLFGYYYTYVSGAPPVVPDDLSLVITKREREINFSWGTESPDLLLPPTKWAAIYKGKVKPKYTETYTFTVTSSSGGVRLIVNGTTLVDQWTNTSGTYTGTIALTANVAVDIVIQYFHEAGSAGLSLSWSSAHQANTIIPMLNLYDPDIKIRRYDINIASSAPSESSDVFDKIFQRIPGWDWTDVDGKVTALPPSRSPVYSFGYDGINSDIDATILQGEFEVNKKARRDRYNWRLYSYRNQALYGYVEDFVEQDRPVLRELGTGMPNNDPPSELMVMNTDLALRIAKMDFKLNSDVNRGLVIGSQKGSGIVTKSQFVTVFNINKDNKTIESSTCLVSSVTRQGNKLSFHCIPLTLPFYTDELVATAYTVTGHVYQNNGTVGISNAIVRITKSSGTTWTTTTNSFGVYSIILNVDGSFNVTAIKKNFHFPTINFEFPSGFSDTKTINIIDTTASGTGSPPDTLTGYDDGVDGDGLDTIHLSWVNHGATGNVIVERKTGLNGSYSTIATLASSATNYDNQVFQFFGVRRYFYRVSNTSVAGYSNEFDIIVDGSGL